MIHPRKVPSKNVSL